MHCPIGIMVKDFKEDKKKKEFPNVSKVAVIWFPGAYIRSSSGNNLTFSDAPSVDRYMLGLFPSLVSFKNISILMLCVYKRIKRLYNYIRASPFRLYISMARSLTKWYASFFFFSFVYLQLWREGRDDVFYLAKRCKCHRNRPWVYVSEMYSASRPCVSGFGGNHTSKISSLLVFEEAILLLLCYCKE